MAERYPTCDVKINRLAERKHADGEMILHALTAEREIQMRVEQGRYWVYRFVISGKSRWTRLAAGRDTLDEARQLALAMVREKL